MGFSGDFLVISWWFYWEFDWISLEFDRILDTLDWIEVMDVRGMKGVAMSN